MNFFFLSYAFPGRQISQKSSNFLNVGNKTSSFSINIDFDEVFDKNNIIYWHFCHCFGHFRRNFHEERVKMSAKVVILSKNLGKTSLIKKMNSLFHLFMIFALFSDLWLPGFSTKVSIHEIYKNLSIIGAAKNSHNSDEFPKIKLFKKETYVSNQFRQASQLEIFKLIVYEFRSYRKHSIFAN
jgi:hypothetical protein